MLGTLEEECLPEQLLKEYAKTSQLIQISNLMQGRHQKEKKSNSTPQSPTTRRRDPELSPLSLQRKYLPRRGKDRPQRAHPPAAAAAERPQVQPLKTFSRHEIQTTNATTPNRSTRIKLTRFKPGFEQQTEYELACAFCRPMRTYKEDPPYYPWVPPEPQVNFHLNFKG